MKLPHRVILPQPGSWYLAGPMTGYPHHNFPAFNAAAEDLRLGGWDIVSPAELDGDIPDRDATEEEWQDYLRRDLGIVLESTGVIVLPGWEASKGATLEVQTALGLGLPVYLYDAVAAHGVREFEEPAASGEVRVVNASTGGEKGQKLARFDLLPSRPLSQVAEHYGRGAAKYEDRNWERGYDWSLSFGALQRHAWAFWGGEDNDPETGTPHMAAVVFHAMALLEFSATHPELDNRPAKRAA